MKVGSWRIATLVASPLVAAGLLATGIAQQPAKSGAAAQSAENPASGKPTAPAQEALPQSEAKLSPAQLQLRDRLRRVLAFYLANQTFNTRDNTPNEVLQFCLAFGADAQLGYDGPTGTKVNALGSLCWNTPCAGYGLLQIGDDRLVARVGFGLQDCPTQFLAVLAQSHVPADYEIRVGQVRKTVANLVESEKLSCRDGNDLSMKLVGLSHYLPTDAAWKNSAGESWLLERLIKQEVDRKVSQANEQTTDRLMGLSYALERRARNGRPIEGQYVRAQKHVADYQEFALRVANADGSWNPQFFAARGPSSDAMGTLRSTGHILEWLVFSLPDDRLQDAQLAGSLGYVIGILESWQRSVNTAAVSPRLLDTIMHAAHALAIYDQRVFEPYDAETPDAKKEDAKNGGSTNASARLPLRSSPR